MFCIVPYAVFFYLILIVFAINGLYTALGSPSLPGWVTNGGDPCVENWQGVGCAASNITAMYVTSGAVLFLDFLCR